MHRAVSVLQVLVTGEYLLHPFGTFRGYGGYVGIYPYRLLADDCSDEDLGKCVIELLEQSKATGYQIKEIAKYRSDQNDPTSDRLREQFFGSDLRFQSGKFRHSDVSQR